jgi:hypothetical protein
MSPILKIDPSKLYCQPKELIEKIKNIDISTIDCIKHLEVHGIKIHDKTLFSREELYTLLIRIKIPNLSGLLQIDPYNVDYEADQNIGRNFKFSVDSNRFSKQQFHAICVILTNSKYFQRDHDRRITSVLEKLGVSFSANISTIYKAMVLERYEQITKNYYTIENGKLIRHLFADEEKKIKIALDQYKLRHYFAMDNP